MTREAPAFRKHDRYKVSSYRTYNFKMPARYDRSCWMTVCQTHLWDRTVLDELRPGLARLAILDVGCATGRLLGRLAEAGARRLAGADLAPNILEVARGKLAVRGAQADLRVADVEDTLPWPAASFDAVVTTGVFHHLYRPRDALREMARVLRPGGGLLLVDPGFFPPVRQIFNLALRIAPHEGDCRFHSLREATTLVEEAGLCPRGGRRIGLWAYLVAGVKPSDP